ncbi:acetate/propionate family kinase [Pseudahrensia aquimaris]|uniref:Acetate kinase n=1 Tax=Pseudahrensia aquimaris TaxID=744461 RepID=A0ABW3FFS4_9HYPH
MRQVVLTLNAGSSSVKFALFDADGDPTLELVGRVEGIGSDAWLRVKNAQGETVVRRDLDEGAITSPTDALATIMTVLSELAPDTEVRAVGHRIVHGGVDYDGPVLLDAPTIAKLEALTPFAPLHQPHNLAGVVAAHEAFPDAPQIGCFDTAFHRHQPWVNDTFALPRRLYDEGVRRFGFHGLSYEYIVSQMKRDAPYHHDGGVIVAHLGNGASMCAIRGGLSVASTMGFSALDGLPMGTRCGQLDPGVVLYMMDQLQMGPREIEHMLYKESGLKGLSGLSNDMRELLASNDRAAKHALDYFVFRIRREIGAMAAVLGGLDAIVFTGGIGENADIIRERVCDDMDWLGLEMDEDRNRLNAPIVSSDRSRVRIFVTPTNEELMIARHASGWL